MQFDKTVSTINTINISLVDQLKLEVAYLKTEIKKLQKRLMESYNNGPHFTIYIALVISLLGAIPGYKGILFGD